jgi:hypothetical protein
VRGRAAIRRYAARAVARFTGWTLTRLTSAYRAGIEVSENGSITGQPTVRVSVSCRSGLITALR